MNNCESLESCESLQRVIGILQFYAYNFKDEKKVISYLESTKFNKYSLNDYHHLLDTHLNEYRMSAMRSLKPCIKCSMIQWRNASAIL